MATRNKIHQGLPQARRRCCAQAQHQPARQELHVSARGHRRHPHQIGARPLPHARLLAVQENPELGRADLPPRHADPLRDRGLSREMPDQDGAGAARQAAVGARHPDLHHRHELRRALLRGQDGACPRRHHGRHRHLLRRRRHDPGRAPLLVESGSTSASRAATASTRTISASRMPASSSSARAARSAWAAI